MNSALSAAGMSGSWRVVTTADKDLQLMLPEADVDDPEVSIVIPALNEAITIGRLRGLVPGGAASSRCARRNPHHR